METKIEVWKKHHEYDTFQITDIIVIIKLLDRGKTQYQVV